MAHALACTTDNGKPNSAWPTRLRSEAGSTKRSPIIAGRSNARPMRRPSTIWGCCWPGRANSTRPSPSFVGRWKSNPIVRFGPCQPGAGLAEQGRFDEAMEHLRRALEINPRGVNAYAPWSHLLLSGEIRRSPGRVGAGDRARSLQYRGPQRSGSAFFELGKIDESIAQFEAALALDPRFRPGPHQSGRCADRAGRIDEAMAHYRRALELDPTNPVAAPGARKAASARRRAADPLNRHSSRPHAGAVSRLKQPGPLLSKINAIGRRRARPSSVKLVATRLRLDRGSSILPLRRAQ